MMSGLKRKRLTPMQNPVGKKFHPTGSQCMRTSCILKNLSLALRDQDPKDFLTEINHPPSPFLKETFGKWKIKQPPTKEQCKMSNTELGLNQECPKEAGPPSVQAKPANTTTKPGQVATVQATLPCQPCTSQPLVN